jgi:hypothetical protein
MPFMQVNQNRASGHEKLERQPKQSIFEDNEIPSKPFPRVVEIVIARTDL